ncbi:MAG: hypothetical protein E7258_05330 [Lachnospiraceae bacterium]|nr:hypothetical protein [Lachnospiraceae bacterium]
MSFSFGLRDLAAPKKRMIMGVLLIALGLFCMIGKNWYQGMERTDCVEVEATFDECKYRSDADGGIDVNSIYLTFDDYGSDLDIHSSCTKGKLTERVMNLKSGTKMKLLVHEKTGIIYELKVDGETWLDFDDARNSIEKNNNIITIVGYIMLGLGAVFTISAIIPLIFRKKTSNCEDFV